MTHAVRSIYQKKECAVSNECRLSRTAGSLWKTPSQLNLLGTTGMAVDYVKWATVKMGSGLFSSHPHSAVGFFLPSPSSF